MEKLTISILLMSVTLISDSCTNDKETPLTMEGRYDLSSQSSISFVEAIKVGDTIEDLDIRDLELNKERTKIDDIANVYGKLKCASTNHMRAFNQKLIKFSKNYTPQDISVNYFNDIITSTNSKYCK